MAEELPNKHMLENNLSPALEEVDMDFKNPAGFLGEIATITEAQYVVSAYLSQRQKQNLVVFRLKEIVKPKELMSASREIAYQVECKTHYLSHSMLFCLGAIIEAHVIITPAICVFGERYKFGIFGGTHRFIEFAGIERQVSHICLHRGYNHTRSWSECAPNMQLALMMIHRPFSFHDREDGADFILNRVRYGVLPKLPPSQGFRQCVYHGFGSRRNGYLIPLLINLRSHTIILRSPDACEKAWNYVDSYLCMETPPCLSEKYGALCPDDVGSLVVCDGVAKGMMVSRLVDRPCGAGFIDLERYRKFIMCGVDDSRELIGHDDFFMYDFTSPPGPELQTPEDALISAEVESLVKDEATTIS